MKRMLMMLGVVATSLLVFAADPKPDGGPYTETVDGIQWTFTVQGGEASVGTGSSSHTAVSQSTTGNITIPSMLGGSPVTSVGTAAFYICSGLTSVTIPSSATSIGNYTFMGCGGLTNVTIQSDVTSIGDYAFAGCRGLTSVTIPSSVTNIGGAAFYGCSGLASVTIPNGVTSIGDGAFVGCIGVCEATVPGWKCEIDFRSVTNLVISEGTTSIDSSAFYSCSALKSVTIPASVTNIGNYAFSQCDGLTSFVVDSKSTHYQSVNGLLLTKDGRVLVAGVNGDVVIPLSVTCIGLGAFRGCSMLTSVTIPSSVTNIDERAFFNCIGLTSVTIPEGVTSIGSWAFYACDGLTSVEIPISVTSIGQNAFKSCANVCELTIPGTYMIMTTFPSSSNTSITNVTIAPRSTEIGKQACSYCARITNVTIPLSVTNIGVGAFAVCDGLTSLKIPESVINIDSSAFAQMGRLTEIFIPSSVVNIGSTAFAFNPNLTNVTISSGVKSIGSYVFKNCSGLTYMTVPSSVTSIGKNAFTGCENLGAIDFEGAPPAKLSQTEINQDAAIRYNVAYEDEWLPVIEACGFTNATPYVPPKHNGGPYSEVVDGIEWTFVVTNLESVVIGAPEDMAGKVTIPSTLGGRAVTSVGESAFDECKGMTGVVIPSSVVSVGTNAFDGCTMVRKVEFEGAPSDGWLNAIPGAWTKIYYNEAYSSEWKVSLGASGIEDGIPYAPGSAPKSIVNAVYLTVTNVVVQYVLNSVQPEIAVPVSGDTGFVAVITEVTSTGAVSVPIEWRDNYPTFKTLYGNDFGKSLMMKSGKKDGAGNEMFVWQDYVAGTDPTDVDDKFTASVTMVGDVPVISYTPELTAEQTALREYKTFGKKQLKDEWTNLTDADGETMKNYNFFKVTVQMK